MCAGESRQCLTGCCTYLQIVSVLRLGTSMAFTPTTSSHVTASAGLSACLLMRSPSLCEQHVRDPPSKRQSPSDKDSHPAFPESGDAQNTGRSPCPSIEPNCGDGILLTAQTLLYHTSTITNVEWKGGGVLMATKKAAKKPAKKAAKKK